MVSYKVTVQVVRIEGSGENKLLVPDYRWASPSEPEEAED